VGYTHSMSKRLQVVLEDQELREIQRAAARQRMSVSEWVRHALRRARRQEPASDARKKIDAIRAAVRHEFPTGDIEDILADIERGYLADGPPPT